MAGWLELSQARVMPGVPPGQKEWVWGGAAWCHVVVPLFGLSTARPVCTVEPCWFYSRSWWDCLVYAGGTPYCFDCCWSWSGGVCSTLLAPSYSRHGFLMCTAHPAVLSDYCQSGLECPLSVHCSTLPATSDSGRGSLCVNVHGSLCCPDSCWSTQPYNCTL